MSSLRMYAAFILQTRLELGQIIYRIHPEPFLYNSEELKYTIIKEYHPDIDSMYVCSSTVTKDRIWHIIDNWNVIYFPTEAAAQQALKEYKDIIAIEDEETRYNEYDNWFAERSSWMVG